MSSPKVYCDSKETECFFLKKSGIIFFYCRLHPWKNACFLEIKCYPGIFLLNLNFHRSCFFKKKFCSDIFYNNNCSCKGSDPVSFFNPAVLLGNGLRDTFWKGMCVNCCKNNRSKCVTYNIY